MWRGGPLDTPPLPGPHAVVRLWGHVLHAEDLEAGGLQRADRRLAAGAWALDEDFDLLQTVLHALAGARVGSHLRGERRRLARALEARGARRLPDDHVPVGVGKRDDRVVERRLDVRLSDGDVLADTAPGATAPCLSSRRSHYVLLGAFLPRPTVFFGPLRVRALVFVRWPFTGRPRRWRTPRYAPISPSRLIACWRSRRRSPSTWRFVSMYSRSFVISPSVRSLTFVSRERPSSDATCLEVERPMPKMYVSATSRRFSRGRFTPAILAIYLSLPLLVPWVGADDHGPAVPPDHAAPLT